MVKPSARTVQSVVQDIPKGSIATLDSIREYLANRHDVHTACPAATLKALIEASNSNPNCGYWRVVKRKGELIAKLNGGAKKQGSQLAKEGLTIYTTKKVPTVYDLDKHLYDFS